MKATVYSGNGIVGDSDPTAEVAETRAKFQAILGALVRP
jgi:isochorismate synthase EntC